MTDTSALFTRFPHARRAIAQAFGDMDFLKVLDPPGQRAVVHRPTQTTVTISSVTEPLLVEEMLRITLERLANERRATEGLPPIRVLLSEEP